MQETYFVKAIWDDEASVWISESDIPGLIIEADTLEEFQEQMKSLAPEMLSDNVGIHNARVPVEFLAVARREYAVA